jgi:fructose-1,6-bisphosphatase II / sedoheptulose-1,7-bisphosphatase
VQKNIELLAKAKSVKTNELKACILKRSRHDHIVKILDKLGTKIDFISDGDVSGVMSVANSNIDIYMGIGGGPEGVLAAAALKCLNCQMQTRLVFQNNDEKKRAKSLGVKDINMKYYIEDMVRDDVIFCATGVTDGDLVKGIVDLDKSFLAETLVLHKSSNTNKIIKNKVLK